MSLNTLFKISQCLHISLDYLIKGAGTDELDCFVRDNEKNGYLENNINNSHRDDIKEVISLINRCSRKEISIIKDIIKIILPHLKK